MWKRIGGLKSINGCPLTWDQRFGTDATQSRGVAMRVATRGSNALQAQHRVLRSLVVSGDALLVLLLSRSVCFALLLIRECVLNVV